MTPENLKAARKKAKHTQTEAAEICGLGLRTWQGYEWGESPVPFVVWRYYLLVTGQNYTDFE